MTVEPVDRMARDALARLREHDPVKLHGGQLHECCIDEALGDLPGRLADAEGYAANPDVQPVDMTTGEVVSDLPCGPVTRYTQPMRGFLVREAYYRRGHNYDGRDYTAGLARWNALHPRHPRFRRAVLALFCLAGLLVLIVAMTAGGGTGV